MIYQKSKYINICNMLNKIEKDKNKKINNETIKLMYNKIVSISECINNLTKNIKRTTKSNDIKLNINDALFYHLNSCFKDSTQDKTTSKLCLLKNKSITRQALIKKSELITFSNLYSVYFIYVPINWYINVINTSTCSDSHHFMFQ